MNAQTLVGVVAVAALLGLAAVGGGCNSGGTTSDAGPMCSPGQAACALGCTNPQSDFDNCGSCGNACMPGQVCSMGMCALSCAGGTTQCGKSCVETSADSMNCGACGKACTTGEVCSSGMCTSVCASGQSLCTTMGGSYCANIVSDNQNCGMCGNVCGTAQVCAGSHCVAGCGGSTTADGGDGGTTYAYCAPDGGVPYCTDIASDNQNCGTCGNACNGGSCVGGSCSDVVLVWPPSGTLTEPGNSSYWSGRYYTITFTATQTLSAISWRANMAMTDSIRAEIWDPVAKTSLATGTTAMGAGVEQFNTSAINFTFTGGTAYIVGIFISNANTVFPRKDTPTYPFTTTDLKTTFTVSACWATSTTNTDIFPTSPNSWAPELELTLQ